MRFTSLGLAAGVIAITVAPTGCGIIGGSDAVVLFGDSLTVLVTDEVVAKAGGDYEVTSTATWGSASTRRLDPAAKVAASSPDQVVVNLGTNNVLQRHDPTATNEDLSTLLDLLADVPCIHLVTVNEQINYLGQSYTTEAAAINAHIRELAARRLNTDVIDWNQIVKDHAADDIISNDTVHPNPAGVSLLTKAYLDALGTC